MERKYIVKATVNFVLILVVVAGIYVVKKAYTPYERGMFCDDDSIRYPYIDHETVSDAVLMLFGVAMPLAVATSSFPLSSVSIPILAFYLFGVPYERGFHCDDESLRYPYKDSTINTFVVYAVGTFLPVISMSLIEWERTKHEAIGKPLKLWGRNLHPWFWAVYCTFGPFLFGCACSQLTTDFAKYTVGRLRPHFVAICQPDWSKINCSEIYIEHIPCTSTDAHRLKEARLSFPSGHASFATYTMVYFVIYLQKRFKLKAPEVLRPFLQFICLSLAFYTTISRISDYKHHWSDVLSGCLMGVVVAILIAVYCSDLFEEELPTTVKKNDKNDPVHLHNYNNQSENELHTPRTTVED